MSANAYLVSNILVIVLGSYRTSANTYMFDKHNNFRTNKRRVHSSLSFLSNYVVRYITTTDTKLYLVHFILQILQNLDSMY